MASSGASGASSPARAPSVSHVARRSFQTSTAEGRAFLQERIAAYARAMTVLFAIYAVTVITLMLLFPEATVYSWFSVATDVSSVLLMLVCWRVAAGPTRGAALITALDVGCIVDPCFVFALDTITMGDDPVTPWVGLTGLALVVLGRALVVPSSGLRTWIVSWLGVAVFSTGVVIALVQRPAGVGNMPLPAEGTLLLLIGGGFALLAGYGSQQLYGLREQVRAARQLGQYTLLEKIGEGGMGTVYRAQHAMLRRPTAIKILPEGHGEEQIARFEREVQLTSELTHPNTVAIFDYGRSSQGTFYYAMEFLDGVDLETLVERQGAQPVARAVHILRQACGALGEAHDRGLVHRDIKPANMFLCRRGGIADVVKILDFGLVKELDRDAGVTQGDVVAGTPAYISPEAITTPDEVGPAADLYALGAVAYYLVTGEPVFVGATVVEICSHHLSTKPVPPSERSDAELGGLEAIILRCLDKDPGKRFPSAAALGAELGKLGLDWSAEQANEAWDENASLVPRIDAGAAPFASTIQIDVTGRTQAAPLPLRPAADADADAR